MHAYRVSILAIAIINRLIIPCIRARYTAISFGQNIPKINFRFLNNHEQEECNFLRVTKLVCFCGYNEGAANGVQMKCRLMVAH